jgi:hypothetical protein
MRANLYTWRLNLQQLKYANHNLKSDQPLRSMVTETTSRATRVRRNTSLPDLRHQNTTPSSNRAASLRAESTREGLVTKSSAPSSGAMEPPPTTSISTVNDLEVSGGPRPPKSKRSGGLLVPAACANGIAKAHNRVTFDTRSPTTASVVEVVQTSSSNLIKSALNNHEENITTATKVETPGANTHSDAPGPSQDAAYKTLAPLSRDPNFMFSQTYGHPFDVMMEAGCVRSRAQHQVWENPPSRRCTSRA